MFTGIIEEKGKIKAIKRGAASSVLSIEGSVIFDDLKIGDSVAVNGVCLTATKIEGGSFEADVMHETLDRTGLGQLRPGSSVNLERAMAANGRFGGHIVSGHIDGQGVVKEIKKDDNAIWYYIQAPASIMRYIVEKGSIAIDGISLTVAKVTEDTFAVSIIPHTAAETTLSERKTGDKVNLENDIVGKYVEKLTQPYTSGAGGSGQSGLTMEKLISAGF